MKKLIYPIISLACLSMTSCNDADEPDAKDHTQTITLYVDSHKEDMAFLGGWNECLRVKENNDSEWNKHDGIIGFQYEKGYKYELKVEKTVLSNPPADGFSVEYRLLDVVSKKFDGYSIAFKYQIDADDTWAIESDLLSAKEDMSKGFYMIYQGFLKNIPLSIFELVDANGESKFKYGIEMRKADAIDHKYSSFLPEGQIVWAGDWILHESVEDEGVDNLFVILERVSGFTVRSEQPLYVRHWLYKDMTEHYRELYPEANVRSVIVVQDNEYKPLSTKS